MDLNKLAEALVPDENGRIVIEGLEPGTTITARETKTLEGYVLDGAPKSILIKEGQVQTLRFYNSKQGTLVIRKLDSVTKEPLRITSAITTARRNACSTWHLWHPSKHPP